MSKDVFTKKLQMQASISLSSRSFDKTDARQRVGMQPCSEIYLTILVLLLYWQVQLLRLSFLATDLPTKNNISIQNESAVTSNSSGLEPKKESSIRYVVSSKGDEMRLGNNTGRHASLKPVGDLRFPEDYEKFTIRINTWKREVQLKASIEHHASCMGVAQIQVIWCIEQGEPPEWLVKMENKSKHLENDLVSLPFIVVERHEKNSLNERFLALKKIPTAGVLSIDDDVLRPCISLQSAFAKWAFNPDRQVGFDARSHQVDFLDNEEERHKMTVSTTKERWSYTYCSTTEKRNQYSITLTRYSFLHRDYLYSYWAYMPAEIRQTIVDYANCEDIAMSLWISANTGAKPPLLADYWAVRSELSLYVGSKISGGNKHKDIRNRCVDDFSSILRLKGKLHHATLYNRNDESNGYFDYGDAADDWNRPNYNPTSSHLIDKIMSFVDRWKEKGSSILLKELLLIRRQMALKAYAHGLIENTVV